MSTTDITASLKKFFAKGSGCAWIKSKHIEIYVRRGYHSVGLTCEHTFDIASVNIPEKHQARGVFTRWHDAALAVAKESGFRFVYVENAFNPILHDFCRKRGYTQVPHSYPLCFYKELK